MTHAEIEDMVTSKCQAMNDTLSETLRKNQMIASICERIRSKQATEQDWAYLNQHAPPTLVQAMAREVCLRNAGIEPYSWLKGVSWRGWLKDHS